MVTPKSYRLWPQIRSTGIGESFDEKKIQWLKTSQHYPFNMQYGTFQEFVIHIHQLLTTFPASGTVALFSSK
jgi:hypothetical protein